MVPAMTKWTIPTPVEIQKAAKSRGWTIKRLCEIAGVADETFSRWKKGTHNIGVDKLELILAALRTPQKRGPKPRRNKSVS